MLEGLVQNDYQLTLQQNLERMRRVVGTAEVVTLVAPGEKTRASYAEVAERVDRLAAGLASLGVEPGDRVGTLCWNHQTHLEAYLAIPCMGAVLHTLNLRLFPEQLEYIVNHARDKVILVDDSLVPLLEPLADRLESVERYVVIGDGDCGELSPSMTYDELLDAGGEFSYPELDERQAAGLCYTSGTTGNPKGVLYSHRSSLLHALAQSAGAAFGITPQDRILPVVPMFHANAWGLAYAGTLSGADLIMPNRFLQAEPLAGLIESERVTVAGAVPTIWMDLLRYADEHRPDFSSLRIVPCGGAAVPRALMQGFEERHGVHIVQAWGMTEMSPLGSIAHPPQGAEGEEAWRYRTTAGQLSILVDFRLMNGEEEVSWDGESTGEVEVRGPWVASAYYEDPTGDEKFHDGWLRTGDIGAITPDGYLRLTDRSKDVIKSGGEWISSVELENELMGHPGVTEAAVIAMPDERWSERPLACVVAGANAPSAEDLREYLGARVAKWWVPDAFEFIDEVPKTSTGKFDKKVLRSRLADGDLEVVRTEKAAAAGG